MRPEISVIVPVYNVAPYLERCVLSLLHQCGPQLEFILVNDGSTDHSLEICRRFAEQDSRVRVISKENGGLASARNAGLQAACGEYISFVDGDDWLEPDAYQQLAELIKGFRPDLIRFGYQKMLQDKVIGSYALSYEEGIYQGDCLRAIQLDTISNPNVLDYQRTRILSAWSNLFRKELLTENEIHFVSEREILNEDYLFVLQAVLAAKSIYVCKHTLYNYDTRPNSLTTSSRPQMYQRKQALYSRYEAVLPIEDPLIQARLRNFYIDCLYACIVNECTGAKAARQSIDEIHLLLRDERLQQCLVQCRAQMGTPKVKVICALMRYKMAGCIYWGYRWATRQRRKQISA